MKTVLKSLDEFQINSIFLQSDNQLCISFADISSYDELRAKLTVSAMREVKVYQDNMAEISEIYENFTRFVTAKTIEIGDGTIEVIATFEKEDEISQRISQNAESIASINATVDSLLTEIIPAIMTEIEVLKGGAV